MANLRERIASILDIPNNDSWQIVDTNTADGLYLIHYSPDASMIRYGSLQGVVVDVTNKVIVARSLGFTPVVTASTLQVAEYDDNIHLTDAVNPNINYIIDPKTTLFFPGFEGTIMRVFLYRGRVYHSTHKKLDANRARWGNSPTFLEIYRELGGPADKDLFDLSKNYSPIVHIFILVHPTLQVVSKTLIGNGCLVYLGSYRMWDPETSPYPHNEIDLVDHGVVAVDEFIPNSKEPFTYAPREMTLEEVNKYLSFGFHQNIDQCDLEDRLLPGEFVIAYLQPKEDQISGTLRIESPAYHWRASLRDNNPNLFHQFYLLSNGKFIQAQYDNEREIYLRKFPILTPYEEESIIELLKEEPIIIWPQENLSEEIINEILADPSSRLYNIFLAFLYSLPPHLQGNSFGIYQEYQKSISAVADWLIDLYERGDSSYDLIPSRARQIINAARSNAQRRIEEGSVENLGSLVNEEIRRLLELEEGASLFHLSNANRR
jgi:hypothetical protein